MLKLAEFSKEVMTAFDNYDDPQTLQSDFRKLLFKQLANLGKPESGVGKIAWVKAALKDVGVTYNLDMRNLVSSFSKGRGDLKISIAIYYWMRADAGRAEHAVPIDALVFGSDEHFSSRFRFSNPAVKPLAVLEQLFADDFQDGNKLIPKLVKGLSSFLENYTIQKQSYPTALLLLIEMDAILRRPDARLGMEQAIGTVRNALDQYPWIDPNKVHGSPNQPREWMYHGEPVMMQKDGANFVLVKPDGTRISSDSITAINNWLIKVHALMISNVIDDTLLDYLLRYILVLCGFRRSHWFKWYFIDDAARLNSVFEYGARRAKANGIDMRSYGKLDAPYQLIMDA